jgi:hypothetical protein
MHGSSPVVLHTRVNSRYPVLYACAQRSNVISESASPHSSRNEMKTNVQNVENLSLLVRRKLWSSFQS